jgi:putative DNA primase/helicase
MSPSKDDKVVPMRTPSGRPSSRRRSSSSGGPPGASSPAPRELPSPKVPMAVARAMVKDRYLHPVGQRLLRHWRGGFLHWVGSHWVELEVKAVRADAYRFTEHAVYVEVDKNGVSTTKPWAPNRYKIADLLDATAAVCHLPEGLQPPTWMEEVRGMAPAHELVSVGNGLLHIRTRQLHPHDPRFFNQVAVPFDYDATVGEPNLWLEFLDELWPDDADSVAALQEFFGYVISGRTDLHKILLLIGPTRAGKGVIARVLKQLLGPANVTGPTLAAMGTNFGLQDLVGKPLAVISDARLGGTNVHQVVERLLSVSGEDTLTIDRKYKDPWTGQLPTRFLVISNELPRFGDASGAIANRFVVLHLTNSFLGRENPNLTKALLNELPGILNWSLDGLQRLHDEGRFTEPESSRDAILALQDLVSPVAAFVRDRCQVGPTHEMPVDDLYGAWKSWAEDNGQRVTTAQTFGRDLRAVVPALSMTRPRENGARLRLYRGISLMAPADNDSDRGPSRTTRPVGGGPRTNPLSGQVADDDLTATCDVCGASVIPSPVAVEKGWATRCPACSGSAS